MKIEVLGGATLRVQRSDDGTVVFRQELSLNQPVSMGCGVLGSGCTGHATLAVGPRGQRQVRARAGR